MLVPRGFYLLGMNSPGESAWGGRLAGGLDIVEGDDEDHILHVEAAREDVGLADFDEVDQVAGAEDDFAVLDEG